MAGNVRNLEELKIHVLPRGQHPNHPDWSETYECIFQLPTSSRIGWIGKLERNPLAPLPAAAMVEVVHEVDVESLRLLQQHGGLSLRDVWQWDNGSKVGYAPTRQMAAALLFESYT